MCKSMSRSGSKWLRFLLQPKQMFLLRLGRRREWWQAELHEDASPGRVRRLHSECRAALGAQACSDPEAAGCFAVFGSADCRVAQAEEEQGARTGTTGGLLFFAPLGRLSNCMLQVTAARWLAERLGKVAVIPPRLSGEAVRRCPADPLSRTTVEALMVINMSAVWNSSTLSTCRHHSQRHAMPWSEALPRAHNLTCWARSAGECAREVTERPLLEGVRMTRFAHAADLEPLRSKSVSLSSWKPLQVPAGDIYVPDIFSFAFRSALGGPRELFRQCRMPSLTQRAAAATAALLHKLPRRFVCVHWRAEDFVGTETPRARILADGRRVAAAALAVAAASNASHVLLLSNAGLLDLQTAKSHRRMRREGKKTLGDATLKQVREFSRVVAAHGIEQTTRSCTAAPADSEKYACAHASALVLSAGSTFSDHIYAIARDLSREQMPLVAELRD